LVHSKAVAVYTHNPAIGWNTISHRNVYDISRDQLLGLHLRKPPISEHFRLVRTVFLQSSNGFLRRRLLTDAHNRVKNKDRQDDNRIDECGPALFFIEKCEYKRNRGRAKKDNDKLIFELIEYEFP